MRVATFGRRWAPCEPRRSSPQAGPVTSARSHAHVTVALLCLGLLSVLPPSSGAPAEPAINTTVLTPAHFSSFHLATWSVDFADVPDEPLMHPQHEWDEEIGGKGTILWDPIDEMYKAWYISQPGIDYTTYNSSEGASRMITFATSADGVNWERPLLPIVPFNGSDSNILIRLDGTKEASYACVFIDPAAANASRRYEMLALLSGTPANFAGKAPKRGQFIYRYYSPDGVRWTPENVISAGPCYGTWCSDSLYINKLPNGTLQAILKHGPPSGAPPGGMVPFDVAAGSARWIYVSTSDDDGATWSNAELALSPDWRDGAGFQVISSISTIRAANALVGWLPVFHSLSQTIDMQFCASLDGGQTWWRPERRSAVQFKELGYYGGGMMWPYRLFVPDRKDPSKLHGYFSGCQGRHADIHSTLAGERFAKMRSEWTSNGAWGYTNIGLGSGPAYEEYSPVRGTNWFRGALMRATWEVDRLWALIPAAGGDIPGQAITVPHSSASVADLSLVVNAKVHNQTRSGQPGSVAVEVLDASTDTPVPGYSVDDCIAVAADEHRAVVRWKGGATLPAGPASVKLRFVLLRARLYAFQFCAADGACVSP